MHKPPIIWLNVIIFMATGLLTFVGVPLYALWRGFDAWQITAMLIAIAFCEISITAGYHRLWSHRAYEAHRLVRLVFAIGGAFATQNSILHWASDHRRHHRYVDDHNKDPYSASKGFWYSHIGWMLREYNTEHDPQYRNCKDLQQDPLVMWQHKHYTLLALGLNFGIPLLLGLWHGDVLGMLLLVGAARLVISHHFTFFINSLAHLWGRQPYSDQNTSRDNGFLALLTMGEGYHNYHHSFQRDYRNGIYWWQFDPTKWLINVLAWLGLARNLYRTSFERIETLRARMLLKTTAKKLSRLPNSDELLQRLQREYETLLNRANDFARAKKQWLEASKASVMQRYELVILKRRVKTLKVIFRHQKKNWLLINEKLA